VTLRGAQVREQRVAADRCVEHDVGAEVGEQLRAVRPRDPPRAVDDPRVPS
jgi:hypothetical protein